MNCRNGLLILLTVLICFSCKNDTQNRFGGLALYTLRDDMAKKPKETLQAIANTGYKYVEDAGYHNGEFYGMQPSEFKLILEELALIPISSHQGGITYENADQTIKDLKEVGFEYLVVPIPPMGLFTVDQKTRTMGMKGGVANLAEILTNLGKKCNDAGLKLLYHNHDFEFKKDSSGRAPIDYLLENTDPNVVNFQMDLFWVTKAGADPIAYFEKYPGRFKMWHVKDLDEKGNFAPVGNGIIDFGKIRSKKDVSGMKYYLVEQDRTFNHTPLEAIKISYEGLKKFGFN